MVEGSGSIPKEKGEKLSPSHLCPQSKTSDGISCVFPTSWPELRLGLKNVDLLLLERNTYFFHSGGTLLSFLLERV